jgi:hypothetical protein
VSYVTSILISGLPRRDEIDQLSAWLESEDYGTLEGPLHGGGRKGALGVWLGGFNYLDITAFLMEVLKVDWTDPGALQVLACGDNQYQYHQVWPPKDLRIGARWWRYRPEQLERLVEQAAQGVR